MAQKRISEEAARKATGHGWDHWWKVLDAWGAKDRTHKEIAAYLQDKHDLSGWWAQTVTVEYERKRGLRRTGQVASGGYQVGVMRTLDLNPDEAWKRVVRGKGLAAWLGEGAPHALKEGQEFTLKDGTRVIVRVVREGSHVRLFWQPEGWRKHSIVQVRVSPRAGDRAAVQFHHEELPRQEDREAMRTMWKDRLGRLDRPAPRGR